MMTTKLYRPHPCKRIHLLPFTALALTVCRPRHPVFAGRTGVPFIVGYASNGLQNGATMVVPQFIDAGSDSEIDLQSIVATGDEASDNVQIQTLDSHGYTVDSYDWNNWANAEACWVDANWEKVEGVTFKQVQGLLVRGSLTTQGFQSAGKVSLTDVVVQLCNGATQTGNPFPVAINLQDILAEGDYASDNIQIQTVDSHGYTVDAYDWNDWANAEACWVDANWKKVEGVTFKPGQGFLVMGGLYAPAQSIRLPAPDL